MTVTHPAHVLDRATLRRELDARVEARLLRRVISPCGDLSLYTYTDQCVFERAWDEYTRVARGLILGPGDELVATPFPKFFNYGEQVGMADLPDEPFEVFEKLDGSLGILYHWRGAWRCATRGSFTSEQAQWGTQQLAAMDWDLLTPGTTYCAELVYRANRIVVDYGYEGMVLLGGYDRDGEELALADMNGDGFWQAPRTYAYGSLADLLTVAETLSANEEGFVVRFASGLRIKIKGAEYCRVHRLISRVTPLAVWEMIVAGDDLDAVRVQLPEEFRRDYDTIVALLHLAYTTKLCAVQLLTARYALMDDRTFGTLLPGLKDEAAKWVFPMRKGTLDLAPGSVQRRRFCDSFRPTGNHLSGYRPSTAMNRFSEAV